MNSEYISPLYNIVRRKQPFFYSLAHTLGMTFSLAGKILLNNNIFSFALFCSIKISCKSLEDF